MKTYTIFFNKKVITSKGETPTEAFIRCFPGVDLVPVVKGTMGVNVRIELSNGSRKSTSYYIARKATIKPKTKAVAKPKPIAKPKPVAKAKPVAKPKPVVEKHFICALYDTDSHGICGVIYGRTSSFEKVKSIVEDAKYGHSDEKDDMYGWSEWERLEELLPKDCELVGMDYRDETTLEW